MSAQKRLRVARKRRTQIASLFDALKNEHITLERVLEAPPAYLGNVSIHQVMMHTPRLGPEGIKKCLMACKVWPEDKIASLDADCRANIIKHLPPRARKFKVAS